MPGDPGSVVDTGVAGEESPPHAQTKRPVPRDSRKHPTQNGNLRRSDFMSSPFGFGISTDDSTWSEDFQRRTPQRRSENGWIRQKWAR